MTLLNYTDPVPLPPPTASATTVSYTDPLGDVWVAKAGVYGGNWRRARDVLHSRMWRNGAFTFPTTAAAANFDTVARDPYGIWTAGSTGFVVPVGGMYLVGGKFAITFTATGQSSQVQLYQAGVLNSVIANFLCSTVGSYHLIEVPMQVFCAAGDNLQIYIAASVASLAGVVGSYQCNGYVSYLGTG